MTTKRTYECNLCRSELRDGAARGFKYGSGRIEWGRLSECENHICDMCTGYLFLAFQDSGIVDQFGKPSARDSA